MKNASAGTFRSALVALGRRRGAAWSIGAAVVAAVAILARLGWARRLDRRTRGTEPGVYADDGVLLHTVMEGSADAPLTVVFAHGFAARLAEYDDQRDALRERARLVLFDQRGHGDSGWGSFRSISIDRLGRDLGCVIDQVAGPAPVVLVAHSMGGMAALALAARRPELFGSRIAGVALLSTAAGQLPRVELPGWTARVALRSGAALLFAWWLWFVAPAVNTFAPFRRRWGRRWLKRHLFGLEQPRPSAVSRMEDMRTNTAQSMAAAFYPAMVAYNRTEALEVLRAVPTLVLAGTDDATLPFARSEHLAKEIGAGARLVAVSGAGHMVNMTHPETVNAAIVDLLDRVRAEKNRQSPHLTRADARVK